MTLQTVKRPSALPSPVPPETATRSGPSREFPLPEPSGTEKTQQRPPLLPPQHLPQPAPAFSQPHVTSGPWQDSEDLRRGRASEATARTATQGAADAAGPHFSLSGRP
uniref:alpha carbonic anhydrase 8-like n=1 Tax=Macaca mulatta TaxID=9544 RepID=UPI0010A2A185|nr:alpha carbonic anhydrase 8-like [Macaca mulatta]